MSAPDVRIQHEHDRVRFVVTDEIDLASAADLHKMLTDAIDNHTKAVELDLTGVTYLDSAGLQVLYRMTERLQLAQIDFRIIAPPRTPARFAIEMSGMASICPLVGD